MKKHLSTKILSYPFEPIHTSTPTALQARTAYPRTFQHIVSLLGLPDTTEVTTQTLYNMSVTSYPFRLNEHGLTFFHESIRNELIATGSVRDNKTPLLLTAKARLCMIDDQPLGMFISERGKVRNYFFNLAPAFIASYRSHYFPLMDSFIPLLHHELFPRHADLLRTFSLNKITAQTPVSLPNYELPKEIPLLSLSTGRLFDTDHRSSTDFRTQIYTHHDAIKGGHVSETGVGIGSGMYDVLALGASSYIGTDISKIYVLLAKANLSLLIEAGCLPAHTENKVSIRETQGTDIAHEDRTSFFLFNTPGIYTPDFFGQLEQKLDHDSMTNSYYMTDKSFEHLFMQLRGQLERSPEKKALWRILNTHASKDAGMDISTYAAHFLQNNGLQVLARAPENNTGIVLFQKEHSELLTR